MADEQKRVHCAALSLEEQRSLSRLYNVASYLEDPDSRVVAPGQQHDVDCLARDLNLFLDEFIEARERLRGIQFPDDDEVFVHGQESNETVMESEIGLALKTPLPKTPITPAFDTTVDELSSIFLTRDAGTQVEDGKGDSSLDGLVRPDSPILSSQYSVSSIEETTRRDSNGVYHRVPHDWSKKPTVLNTSLFDKAKAMLANTAKKPRSGQAAKLKADKKKQVKPEEEGASSASQQPLLKRVRRKLSRGDGLKTAD